MPWWVRSGAVGAALLSAAVFLAVAVARENVSAGAACLFMCLLSALIWDDGGGNGPGGTA